MKRFILSASAVTLSVASMTAAAWWAHPYYGTPYAAPILSPQQAQAMAERQRDGAIQMMEAQRKAMEAHRKSIPDAPGFADAPALPELPSFGQRPDFPEMPAIPERPPMPESPAFGEIPQIPQLPGFGQIPERPKMPFDGERPALPEPPARPDFLSDFAMPELPIPDFGDDSLPAGALLTPEERQAEREAQRKAMQERAAERRAAMEAIAKQRRALSEQRHRDWVCSRPARSPMAYQRLAGKCNGEGTKSKAEDGTAKPEQSDKTANSTPTASKAG